MALGGLNDPLQSAVFILIVIFTPLCILATVFRFIASRIAVGKVGMEDWLAFSALAVFLGYIVCVSISRSLLTLIVSCITVRGIN